MLLGLGLPGWTGNSRSAKQKRPHEEVCECSHLKRTVIIIMGAFRSEPVVQRDLASSLSRIAWVAYPDLPV